MGHRHGQLPGVGAELYVLMPRWHSAPDLLWTHYDDSDDWIVFNPRSGDVHLLTASAHLLWQLVEQDPRLPTDHLIAALASTLDRSIDEEFATAVREAIDFMDRVGLIAPVAAA